MEIQRVTRELIEEGVSSNVYDVFQDDSIIDSFYEKYDDYALVKANELMEDLRVVAKTRGVLPKLKYN